MSQEAEKRSGAESKGNEEGVPEIRVKQDKILLLLLILMIACIGIECGVPFLVETYDTGTVTIYFRFWYVVTGSHPTTVNPWFLAMGTGVGIFGFSTGLCMLALTGVSFVIALVHKLNKNLFLEKGAIIPYIIAGFSSLLFIPALIFPDWEIYSYGNRVSWMPIADIAIGACGVLTLVLANVFRVGPWLRAPVSWKEAVLVKTMEAGIFPILVVLKKLQETKGEIDLNVLSQIYGRMRGTIKVKIQRALLTNLIKGHFTGPYNFFLETINLPFIIDDADVPQSIQTTVDSMLARATAAPSTGFSSTSRPVMSVQPVTGQVAAPAGSGQSCSGCGAMLKANAEFCDNCGKKVEVATATVVVPPAPASGAVSCSGCGANVQGKEFCTSCGRKVPVTVTAAVGSPAPAIDSAFCAACGARLKAGAEFCSSCGTKV